MRARVLRGERGQRDQRGATVVEFAIVLPLLLVLTMLILHYGLYFHAKNQVNHALFMAARASTVQNASRDAMRKAYVDALIPLYGGGLDDIELAASRQKAADDVAAMQTLLGGDILQVVNPSRLSFDDWHDDTLVVPGVSGRVISNSGLENRPATLGPSSHQTIQDANLLRVCVTHLYTPQVPLVMGDRLFGGWLLDEQAAGRGGDFFASMVAQGRLPIFACTTLQMQTDPVEN